MKSPVVWIVVAIGLVIVIGILFEASPSARLWADKRPGKPGAVDPTGTPIPESADFKRPRDEGNLL
jgi:hypothetical protein